MNYVAFNSSIERWYFEVDNDFTALRQIVVNIENGDIIASNNKEDDFFLSDQDVNFRKDDYALITN